MDNFHGTIIEESLVNKDILKKLKIISTLVERETDRDQTPWLAQWTLHKVEIPASEAPVVAHALSQNLDRAHDGSWYADFKNNTQHYVIYYDKVFCLDRTSQAQYEAARAYGRVLGVPEHQLITYRVPGGKASG